MKVSVIGEQKKCVILGNCESLAAVPYLTDCICLGSVLVLLISYRTLRFFEHTKELVIDTLFRSDILHALFAPFRTCREVKRVLDPSYDSVV